MIVTQKWQKSRTIEKTINDSDANDLKFTFLPNSFVRKIAPLSTTTAICDKANMMDENNPIESTITVSSNPTDDNQGVLSSVDEQYWTPADDDETPVITITVAEEEEPVTDIIVIGDFDEFTVTLLNKDNVVVKEEVSTIAIIDSYLTLFASENPLRNTMETSLCRKIPFLINLKRAWHSRMP